jgi:hypothetical protein
VIRRERGSTIEDLKLTSLPSQVRVFNEVFKLWNIEIFSSRLFYLRVKQQLLIISL